MTSSGGGGGGVLEGGDAGGGSRVEPMSVELEALKEKVRVLERDGAAPSKFICLVCQVRQTLLPPSPVTDHRWCVI